MTEHAKLSASGAHRWMNCPASIRMEENIPEQTSEYAIEGITAHSIAESCLAKGLNPEDMELDKLLLNSLDSMQELKGSIQIYLDFVRSIPGKLLIEQRVDFSEWVPGGFGTADIIIFNPKTRICHVVDLKYGKGVKVNAFENPQLKLYAAGAFSDYDWLYGIEKFNMVIVQPRLDHISEYSILTENLLHWCNYVVKPSAKLTFSTDAPFSPGEKQCRFCRAKSTCKGLAEFNLELAQKEFLNLDTPTPEVNILTDNQISNILIHRKLITDWISSLEKYATDLLISGKSFPNFKLVHGRANRSWKDVTEAEKALKEKLKISEIFEKKMISPSKAEKLLKKDDSIFKNHVYKPEGKLTLVSETDPRPAFRPPAESEFNIIKDC